MEYGSITPDDRIDLDRIARENLDTPAFNPFRKVLSEMTDEEWIKYHYIKHLEMKFIEDMVTTRKIVVERQKVESIRQDGQRTNERVVNQANKTAKVGSGGMRAVPKSKDKTRQKLYELIVRFDIDKIKPDYTTVTNGELKALIMKHGGMGG